MPMPAGSPGRTSSRPRDRPAPVSWASGGISRAGIHPRLHAADRAFQVLTQLVNPKAHDVPSCVAQAAGTDLVAPAQFAIPVAMVILAVDLDIEFPLAVEQRKIERVRRFLVLRHGAQARRV